MSKSSRLCSQDSACNPSIVGECRELGDDKNSWREHCVEQLALLVDANVDSAVPGRVGCALRPVGSSRRCRLGWGRGFDRSTLLKLHEEIRSTRRTIVSQFHYGTVIETDGTCR